MPGPRWLDAVTQRDALVREYAEKLRAEGKVRADYAVNRLIEDRHHLLTLVARLKSGLGALIADLELRAEIEVKFHGADEVVVPVSGSILDHARQALALCDAPTPPEGEK